MKRDLNIFEYKSGVDYLKAVYERTHDLYPRFSQRSFANKLDIDQSTLTRYFSKERFLTVDRVVHLASKLGLSGLEALYYKMICTFGDRDDLEPIEIFRKGCGLLNESLSPDFSIMLQLSSNDLSSLGPSLEDLKSQILKLVEDGGMQSIHVSVVRTQKTDDL